MWIRNQFNEEKLEAKSGKSQQSFLSRVSTTMKVTQPKIEVNRVDACN